MGQWVLAVHLHQIIHLCFLQVVDVGQREFVLGSKQLKQQLANKTSWQTVFFLFVFKHRINMLSTVQFGPIMWLFFQYTEAKNWINQTAPTQELVPRIIHYKWELKWEYHHPKFRSHL